MRQVGRQAGADESYHLRVGPLPGAASLDLRWLARIPPARTRNQTRQPGKPPVIGGVAEARPAE
jgi:hypothetical protein